MKSVLGGGTYGCHGPVRLYNDCSAAMWAVAAVTVSTCYVW